MTAFLLRRGGKCIETSPIDLMGGVRGGIGDAEVFLNDCAAGGDEDVVGGE